LPRCGAQAETQGEFKINKSPSKSTKSHVQSGFFSDFHKRHSASSHNVHLRQIIGFRKNCATTHTPQPDNPRAAPTLWHPPVNHLHSIENSEDTVPHFSLTLKTKRVKP
jgi:hypothetical protein